MPPPVKGAENDGTRSRNKLSRVAYRHVHPGYSKKAPVKTEEQTEEELAKKQLWIKKYKLFNKNIRICSNIFSFEFVNIIFFYVY